MKRNLALLFVLALCLTIMSILPLVAYATETTVEQCETCTPSDVPVNYGGSYHCFPCTVCGNVWAADMEQHTSDKLLTSEDGTKHYKVCNECGGEYNEHDITTNYGGAMSVGAAGHMLTCDSCHEPVGSVQPHSGSLEYYPDDNGRHHVCCDECWGYTSSQYTEACTYGSEMSWYNDESHGPMCTLCYDADPTRLESHVQDGFAPAGNGHSPYCGICGRQYGEVTPCTPGTEYVAVDEESHVLKCAECDFYYRDANGDYSEEMPHRFTTATPWDAYLHDAICADCGYIVQKEHTGSGEYEGTWDMHWEICKECGDQMGWGEQHVTDDAYFAIPGTNMHAQRCKVCNELAYEEEHYYNWDTIEYERIDAYNHKWTAECELCGASGSSVEYHVFACEGTTCESCGEENVAGMQAHYVGEVKYDENTHTFYCARCGEIYEQGEHTRVCDDDVCWEYGCNAPYTGDNVIHLYDEFVWDDEGHYWACTHCGAKDEESFSPHAASCGDTEGYCIYCGENYPELSSEHYTNGEMLHDDDKHWYECDGCGEIVEEAHYNYCNGNYECWCGHKWAESEPIVHGRLGEMQGNAQKHWQICKWCLRAVGADHTPSEKDPSICSVCEMTIGTVEEHVHDRETIREEPTCTEDGGVTEYCGICGEYIRFYYLFAKGHTMNDEGVCTKCGYTEPKEEKTEPVVVEDVKIEAAEESKEVVPSNAALIVETPVEEVTVEVAEGVKVKAEKVYDVKLLVENEEVAPTSAVKIAIAIAEEEINSFEGKKLMLVHEDGTLVEVEYEIINGELVFETAEMGVFVLVDTEAKNEVPASLSVTVVENNCYLRNSRGSAKTGINKGSSITITGYDAVTGMFFAEFNGESGYVKGTGLSMSKSEIKQHFE